MGYGKDLLAKASEAAGSRYALAKLTGIAESNLSDAWNGKRQVPASWILKLARVAGVDPTEAMEFHDLERAEKKRLRRQSLPLAAAGAVAILLTFASSGEAWAHRWSEATNLHEIDASTHRIYRRRRHACRWNSRFIRKKRGLSFNRGLA
jgi:DNA-binding transcriptional regulator YdaS (Cro superfamily)